jgi:hypothetical protein
LAPLPEKREAPNARDPPEFVWNVTGSSAAGSAEFHIYRKEMTRLENMEREYEEQKRQKEKQRQK